MILLLAGVSKSGKSHVAKHLSEITDWPRVSFGNLVRRIAEERELPATFESLQELGQRLVEESPSDFLNSAFEFWGVTSDSDVIIDGLRHKAVFDELSKKSNRPIKLVLVETRESELRKRHEEAGTDFDSARTGVVDLNVDDKLAAEAHLVVDGCEPSSHNCERIISLLDL